MYVYLGDLRKGKVYRGTTLPDVGVRLRCGVPSRLGGPKGRRTSGHALCSDVVERLTPRPFHTDEDYPRALGGRACP